MKNRWFKIIEVEGLVCKRSKLIDIMHGEKLVGRNPVTVLSGKLCENSRYSPASCKWCYLLMKRIRSRRV